jgi:hypothetical protein
MPPHAGAAIGAPADHGRCAAHKGEVTEGDSQQPPGAANTDPEDG